MNLVSRGTIEVPVKMMLCEEAEKSYDISFLVHIVPIGQLYGGKICAALNRQHPRDLFDVKILLENEGISDSVRKGFLLCLVSSDSPIHEILSPNFHNHQKAMDNQFVGMSNIPFSYKD